jgi:hypothetical protein
MNRTLELYNWTNEVSPVADLSEQDTRAVIQGYIDRLSSETPLYEWPPRKEICHSSIMAYGTAKNLYKWAVDMAPSFIRVNLGHCWAAVGTDQGPWMHDQLALSMWYPE